MKNVKIFVALLLVLVMVLAVVACDVAKNEDNHEYELGLADGISLTLNVGDTDVDFTKFFYIKDENGNSVEVTNEMLDLSKVDTSKEGSFILTLSFGGTKLSVNVTVTANGVNPETTLEEVLDKYSNSSNWNFVIELVIEEDGKLVESDYFGYKGEDIMYKYEATDENYVSKVYTDYIRPVYDSEDVWFNYYSDMGNGKYKVVEITEELYDTMYFPEIWLDNINSFEFTLEGDHYVANDPQAFGDEIYGSYTGVVYTKGELYVNDGEITKIVFLSDETYNGKTHKVESTFAFSQHGTLNFDISKLVIDNDKPIVDPTDIDSILASYEDISNWNFVINSAVYYNGELDYEEEFSHLGNLMKYVHENFYDYTDTTIYVDYVKYNSDNSYTYYGDLGGELYQVTEINESNYGDVYFPMLYLDLLSYFSFNQVGDHYEAVDPQDCGDNVYGEQEGCTYTKVELYVSDGKITKIIFFSDEVYDDETYNAESIFEISGYGTVDFDISSLEIAYGDTVENPEELKEIFAKYEDDLTWNFAIDAIVKIDGSVYVSMGFGYAETDAMLVYLGDTTLMTDYFVYDEESELYWYLSDNGDGTHTKYTEEDFWFYYLYPQMFPIQVGDLANCSFVLVGDHYEAVYPQVTGDTIYGAEDGCVYTSVELYVSNGLIEKVVFYADVEYVDDDGELVSYKEETSFEFSNYNEITVDISNVVIDDSGETPDIPDDPVENPAELQEVIEKFNDTDYWNFAVTLEQTYNGKLYYDYYEYYKDIILNEYEGEDGNTYRNYLVYDANTDTYTLWLDYLNGDYEKLTDADDEFYDNIELFYYVDPSILSYFEFEVGDGFFTAKDPDGAAGYFIGSFTGHTWTTFVVTLSNGNIKTIEAVLDDGTVYCYRFTNYGEIELSLPDGDNPSVDVPDGDQLTSTFIAADLSVGKGELGYSSNLGSNGLDANRGLQFLQANGTVVLTSKSSVEGVTAVKVYVSTNAESGMNVSIKVGGVSLTCNGSTTVLVAKQQVYTELTELVFLSNAPVDGNVVVTLAPTQSKKSMYISTITVVTGNGQGGEIVNPDPVNPDDNVMEDQYYNENTFDGENLQDKLLATDEAIGLPSEGNINVLVIPVQFSGDTITQNDLNKLELAFNGTSQDTGWESVATYYNKTSYGKLNLTFDIQSVFKAPSNSRYYENYSKDVYSSQGSYTEYGDTLLLRQALAYYENLIDLTKYDTNDDGCIDAVYLIYSAHVDYISDDGFYWAYTTWYYGEETYDDLYAYYYLFAGFDFMDEDVEDNDMIINASTYIHETGHLLGLDDYYDYDTNVGSNMGLGGADMMDYTVGDHNAYSKIMLGWTDATIVTSTTTMTIGNFESTGDCILVPLDFNNSYFSEYLLIDLYSATGLNEFASNVADSLLYDGASYGVRIYHVSSSANDPFNNEWGSYTDNNNSDTEFALIKLVEADGEYNFNKSNGYATENDLWQAGDSLLNVFGTYTRNDGKKVNFDITIDAVSATEATVTITFAE